MRGPVRRLDPKVVGTASPPIPLILSTPSSFRASAPRPYGRQSEPSFGVRLSSRKDSHSSSSRGIILVAASVTEFVAFFISILLIVTDSDLLVSHGILPPSARS